MTIQALISGSVFRKPEKKISKNGKEFTAGTLRCQDGESFQFVRFVAFSESAQAELMRLDDGDSVSVQGPLKAELFTPEGGEARVSLSIVAAQALPLRAPPRERKPAASTDPRPRQERLAGARPWQPGDGPDDEISFGDSP